MRRLRLWCTRRGHLGKTSLIGIQAAVDGGGGDVPGA